MDVCISSSLGENLITFPNSSFFECLNTSANCYLFLPIIQPTTYIRRLSTKKGKFNRLCLSLYSKKLNFYSSIKNKYSFAITKYYDFPIVTALMLSNTFRFDCSVIKIKFVCHVCGCKMQYEYYLLCVWQIIHMLRINCFHCVFCFSFFGSPNLGAKF